MNIVIVGHVDHGKSTLIGRLLFDTNSLPEERIKEIEEACRMLGRKLEFAYVLDALEEERRERKTIETTQIFFRSKKRSYTIIDAPGHKEFLKNMVTGASHADAAILVVDVKEGVKEQTKRHAYVLKILGVDRIIVAINKMDLVDYSKEEFEGVRESIARYLSSIGLKPQAYVPISAYNGDNVVKKSNKMDWYKGLVLVEELDKIEIKKKGYDFRFCAQDVYKNIAIGSILSGTIKEGDELVVYPEESEARVKEIRYGTERLKMAEAPLAIGLILEGKIKVKRGHVLCKGKRPKVVDRIETYVMCLIDSLKENEKYELLCYTQEANCKIERIVEKLDVETLKRKSGKELKEAEIGKVVIKLEKSVVMEEFENLPELGRFAIARNGKLIAGGRI